MKSRSLAVIALSLVACLAGPVNAEPAAKMAGGVLVNTTGMTLYTFDNDVPGSGKSKCNGPLRRAVAAGDGRRGRQARRRPDHRHARRRRQAMGLQGQADLSVHGDKKAGDMTGDNFKDVWHVVK